MSTSTSAENILPIQGRDAPAYQEYAANVMATIAYRQMSLTERGLLYTLRLECWVNREMPSDPTKLARVLGQPAEEVNAVLPGVMEFFEVRGSVMVCPELEAYRASLADRRARMVEGGKKSASRRNKHPAQPDETTSDSASTLQAPSRYLVGSLQVPSKVLAGGLQGLSTDQYNVDQYRPNQSLGHDSWASEYEQAETETPATEYARQSRGD